jgi:membrane-bound inhibitor of C-type lysozyme
MRNPNVLLAISMITLSGCASMDASHAQASAPASWTSYACADGRVVQAAYPDTNTAQIKINGEAHTLHIAMSADGARYTGDGWQWWTKGMHDGSLAPLAAGETIANTPGVACHAA